MRKASSILFAAIVAVSVVGLLVLPQWFHTAKLQRTTAILTRVLGHVAPTDAIEQCAADEGHFFGDASYAWRIDITRTGTNWIGEMTKADEADFKAAVAAIQALLKVKLSPDAQQNVLRKKLNGWSIYVVTGRETRYVHLLVHTL